MREIEGGGEKRHKMQLLCSKKGICLRGVQNVSVVVMFLLDFI